MTATKQQQVDLGSFLDRKRLTVSMFLERYNINGSAEALQGFIRAGNWVLSPELQAEIERAQNKLLEASTGVLTAGSVDDALVVAATPATSADPAVLQPKAAQKKPAKVRTVPPVPRPAAE